MSLGIAFKGPEGIVLAADSRVTLSTETQHGDDKIVLHSTFDNATKLLHVTGQDHVGVVTYGLGAIGGSEPRTAHSLMPEFEDDFPKEEAKGRLSVEDFAIRLSQFFVHQWSEKMPESYSGQDMVFLVGGYDAGAAYGRVFQVDIPSKPTPVEHNAGQGVFGLVWGGQSELTNRLIHGFDPGLPSAVQASLGLSDVQRDDLEQHLRRKLSLRIPYQFLPLQDCVNLSICLIRTTITLQTWQVGVRGVGGFIDIATITRTEGFQPIQKKAITARQDLT